MLAPSKRLRKCSNRGCIRHFAIRVLTDLVPFRNPREYVEGPTASAPLAGGKVRVLVKVTSNSSIRDGRNCRTARVRLRQLEIVKECSLGSEERIASISLSSIFMATNARYSRLGGGVSSEIAYPHGRIRSNSNRTSETMLGKCNQLEPRGRDEGGL